MSGFLFCKFLPFLASSQRSPPLNGIYSSSFIYFSSLTIPLTKQKVPQICTIHFRPYILGNFQTCGRRSLLFKHPLQHSSSHLNRSSRRQLWTPFVGLKPENNFKTEVKSKLGESASKVGKVVKGANGPVPSGKDVVQVAEKTGLWATVKSAAIHYWNGFKLLGTNVKISCNYGYRLLQGDTLSRREHRLLVRTTADIAKLIPFSVFIVVPFMEFALPIFLKLFPNMLPSTFADAGRIEQEKKKELKMKLQMAKFLQETIHEMAVEGSTSTKSSKSIKEFAHFVSEIRNNHNSFSNDDILRFSKLFEDEITLDNLSRPQLVALCKLLGLQTYGTSNLLRFQLELKVSELKADDKIIDREGIQSLSVAELQAASQVRGMRAIGLSRDQLISQLDEWLNLNLRQEVPITLLLLSRSLYVNELPSPDALKQAIANLSENVGDQARANVAEQLGVTVDNKTKLDLISKEEKRIQEEMIEEKDKDLKKIQQTQDAVAEKIQVIQEEGKIVEEEITKEEIRKVADVIEELLDKSPVYAESSELHELKVLRDRYKAEISDLKNLTEYKESVASTRLGKRLEKMIGQLDKDILEMSSKMQDRIDFLDQDGDGVVTCSEMEIAIKQLKSDMTDEKIKSIVSSLDLDADGKLSIKEIDRVFDLLEVNDVDLKPQMLKTVASVVLKEWDTEEKRIREQVTPEMPADAELRRKLDLMMKKRSDMQNVVSRVENLMSLREDIQKRARQTFPKSSTKQKPTIP